MTVAVAAGAVMVAVKGEPRVVDEDGLFANDGAVVATVSVMATVSVTLTADRCEETPTPGDPYPLISEAPIDTTVEAAKGGERETVLS